jgi:hypothetical protein
MSVTGPGAVLVDTMIVSWLLGDRPSQLAELYAD